MAIKYYYDVEQHSDEWFKLKLGVLSASSMKLIVTPTLKTASNDKERSHLYQLCAERITGFMDESFQSSDMLRGWNDEQLAKAIYSEKYAPVKDCGFVTNDKYGFLLGWSPDGLVDIDGCIEVKSRRQKFQIETILSKRVPEEFVLQIQTGLLVSERKWCDFISYSGGLPMMTIRIYPDEKIQNAILEASQTFEQRMSDRLIEYRATLLDSDFRFTETERTIINQGEIKHD